MHAPARRSVASLELHLRTEADVIAEARRLKSETGLNYAVYEMADGSFMAHRGAYRCPGAVRHVGSYVQDIVGFVRVES